MFWEVLLKAHWGAIAATNFFSVEVLTRVGLVWYFVLFVIDLKTRKVEECRRNKLHSRLLSGYGRYVKPRMTG